MSLPLVSKNTIYSTYGTIGVWIEIEILVAQYSGDYTLDVTGTSDTPFYDNSLNLMSYGVSAGSTGAFRMHKGDYLRVAYFNGAWYHIAHSD